MIDLSVTDTQRARAEREWSELAGEPIRIDWNRLDERIIAFGSELACLRLYVKFKGKGRVAFTKNLDTWYYRKPGF